MKTNLMKVKFWTVYGVAFVVGVISDGMLFVHSVIDTLDETLVTSLRHIGDELDKRIEEENK